MMMMNSASSLFGYTDTDLDVAAILEPSVPTGESPEEVDMEEWLGDVENRASLIQFLTREHATNDGPEPLLDSLERLRRQRNEIEQQMIHLVAYMRERIKPRPYTLQQIADAAGLAVAGTRTFYDEDDVRTLDERIAATKQHIEQAHITAGTTPGRPTIVVDKERVHPSQKVADDGTIERLHLHSDR